MAPLLNAFLRTVAPGLASIADVSRSCDALLRGYGDLPYERDSLRRYLATVEHCGHALLAPLRAEVSVHLRCAEADDYPGYYDERGAIRRELTPMAIADCLVTVLRGHCDVLIPGTGLAPHRLVPLLERRHDEWIKIVVPSEEMAGYFSNEMSLALEHRSSADARVAGKHVPSDVMRDLYDRQRACLQPGGLWHAMKGLHRGRALLQIIRDSGELEERSRLEEIAIISDRVERGLAMCRAAGA